jgi:hypothetical protein
MTVESTVRIEFQEPRRGRGERHLSLVADNQRPEAIDPRYQAALGSDGYVAFPAEGIGSEPLRARAIRALQTLGRDLPIDPYCKGGYRYRRYARLFLLPWADAITPAPTEWQDGRSPVFTYQQPAALNSEEQGSARRFPAIVPEVLASDWMQHIIRFDFAQLRFTAAELSGPIQVGVHVVELRPREGVPAVASPNRVHRDGEHYTCAHLIERRGVTGGENHIVDPEWADHEIGAVPRAAIRSAFTLENPLDSYIVRDDRVAHHVAGVELAPDAATGSRTILLIDFTPMQPYVLMKPAA